MVAQHPVHVLRREAGVEDGVAYRLHAQRACAAPGCAAVLRFAHAHDAILVLQSAFHTCPPLTDAAPYMLGFCGAGKYRLLRLEWQAPADSA